MNWVINSMVREPTSGVVQIARYCCSEAGESVTGDVFFDAPDDPIAFDSLTEEPVVGWVKEKLGAANVANIEARVTELVNLKSNPPQVEGLPWDTRAE